MRSFLPICALLLLAAASLPGQTPGEPDWRIFDGAVVLGGVNAESLLGSPIVTQLIERAVGEFPESLQTIDQFRAGKGVKNTFFALTQSGQQLSVLVLLRGPGIEEKDLIRNAQGKFQVRRLDPETVLLGDAPALARAVRRLTLPAPARDSAVVAQAKQLSQHRDFWIAGSMPSLPQTALVGGTIRSLSLGINLQSDLNVDLNVEATSPQMAADLAAKMNTSQAQLPPGASMTADVRGSQVHAQLAVPGEEIVKAIASSAGTIAQRIREGLAQQGFGPAAAATPQQPPAPKKIVIYGLDEGPKEIVLPQP